MDNEKLILIDGNSLLNRAYYAIKAFSTREGLPTNGIFGFIKILFKILKDERPQYLAVAFDVHAPTFRHKIYDRYKGTRKPMPEDLAVQVPVLKDLLRKMKIFAVERAGYEADDLIGTLSRRFEGLNVSIYTGDRDAYQLVGEQVTVCYTKRGVSDIERLTQQNFSELTGLTPPQIVDEKALMGDSSDNIPGVAGIGPKTALTLLKTYGTLENIYEHLEELAPPLREKLLAGKESAFLSLRLATIVTDLPLEISPEDCRLHLPFSEEVRAAFSALEFRSLTDSDVFEENRAPVAELVENPSAEELLAALEDADSFSFCKDKEICHVCFGRKEYLFYPSKDLLDSGLSPEQYKTVLSALFAGTKRACVPDLKALAHELDLLGIPFSCPADDVMLLRYLNDSDQRPLEAKALAQEFGIPPQNSAFALRLALQDAQKKAEGTEEETLYRELELPLAYVLLEMERTGVRVDESRFSEFSEKFGAEIRLLCEQIFSLAGESFNLNSPFQLSRILFEKLKYAPEGAKKNQRGGYSTGADTLEKLAEKHEIVRLILRYREIQKLQSTYIEGIKPLVRNGIVHTTYNQTMTTTGRLSSANPNLQNIPVRREEGRELRKLFIAREGNVLIDADYSQIELRLLAHFSGCEALRKAYREGKDIHAATAAQVFGVSPDSVTPELRRRAKAVNFGIIYGISAFGLGKDLGCSSAEAKSYMDNYFDNYPEVREYMQENVNRAKKDGYVTTILGRKRYIRELFSPNFNVRSFGERAAMNMPLQGSSADIIKLAMLGVSRRLAREALRAKLVLQVHDELILDAPREEAARAAALLKEEMEHAVELAVPLIADVSEGESWYEAK